jgi:hypothetical protein
MLNPLERLLYLLDRIPQHHRPSVRARHGTLSFRQLLQQPFHFVLLQRHVDLDGRVARDAGRNLPPDLVQIQHLLFLLELVQQFDQHLFDICRPHASWRCLYRYCSSAEQLNFKPIALQLF